MFGCAMGAIYNMKADVYRQVRRQSGGSGEIERAWEFVDTISIMARGLGNLRGKDFGSTDDWKNMYSKEDFLRIKTRFEIDDTMRITNVRSSDGDIVWKEEGAGGDATIFEVIGVTPSVTPFGKFHEYEALCDRAAVQDFDFWED